MKKLLSLPPNLVNSFHDITGLSHEEWFCSNDPIGHKLGSGGGSINLLMQYWKKYGRHEDERLLLLHAGGQSRRLPAYAPSGKILTPIPVLRWERGQRLSQTLLDLQLPLYERLMSIAPKGLNTMIVSGDVCIRTTQHLPEIPAADVVCLGLWLGPEIAKDHGVFVSSRRNPSQLDFMLQKPSVERLNDLQREYFYLTDIGVWLLSDKAIQVLKNHSVHDGEVIDYDLYGTFGCCLGNHPTIDDPEVAALKVAIVPLSGGEFYHFGTSHELLSSTVALQNLVNDQHRILHHSLKPQPSIFVQNAITKLKFTSSNENVWIENSFVNGKWTVTRNNIVTGAPENDWTVNLSPGDCIDFIPIGETAWCVRRYGYFDTFAGDAQTTPQFPLFANKQQLDAYMRGEKVSPMSQLSAEQISDQANLYRLVSQRHHYRTANWSQLARNQQHSVFYQLDLDDAAASFRHDHIPAPPLLSDDEPLVKRISDAMFRSEISEGEERQRWEQRAFGLLRKGLTLTVMDQRQRPHKTVYNDQIVWGRSPVRIDIAGGWTDTPPYCLLEGGNVINLAIELNGQPPIQTYVRPCQKPQIILRSIDLGATEVVNTYEELEAFNQVGSPFSIPKAALVLCGFHPRFSVDHFSSLQEQLLDFGCGIEVTLLSAIPAGSGLGTSSVLAANVLGSLAEFCGLGWDKAEVGHRTLVLEQLLTTGGGWQDQFGGILHGVKLLQTTPGFNQSPVIRWLPTGIYTQPEYQSCHLLYYTGIRRTAKTILAEIVRKMFLNQHDEMLLLRQMKEHTLDMFDAIQREDFEGMGRLVRKNWEQNQALDSGTNPEECKQLMRLVDDLCLGYKLPGAGGGGYMYMIAKDPEAAVRIKTIINEHRLNPNARFVNMTLSNHGMQISRS